MSLATMSHSHFGSFKIVLVVVDLVVIQYKTYTFWIIWTYKSTCKLSTFLSIGETGSGLATTKVRLYVLASVPADWSEVVSWTLTVITLSSCKRQRAVTVSGHQYIQPPIQLTFTFLLERCPTLYCACTNGPAHFTGEVELINAGVIGNITKICSTDVNVGILCWIRWVAGDS